MHLGSAAEQQCTAHTATQAIKHKQGPAWPTLGSAAVGATAAVVVPSLQPINEYKPTIHSHMLGTAVAAAAVAAAS